MATSTGKTIALILLVLFIFFVGWRLTPFFIAPFGIVTGLTQTLKDGIGGMHIWPYQFRHFSFSILSLFLFILWIVVIVWVYRDAERRGMNGVLWALVVFIGNLIGLLVYLIVRTEYVPAPQSRPSSQITKPCPNCEEPVNQDFAYCPHCAASLQATCPQCGKAVEPDWKVCPHCGKQLKKTK